MGKTCGETSARSPARGQVREKQEGKGCLPAGKPGLQPTLHPTRTCHLRSGPPVDTTVHSPSHLESCCKKSGSAGTAQAHCKCLINVDCKGVTALSKPQSKGPGLIHLRGASLGPTPRPGILKDLHRCLARGKEDASIYRAPAVYTPPPLPR